MKKFSVARNCGLARVALQTLTLVLLVPPGADAQADRPLWNGLDPGPYNVGFRVDFIVNPDGPYSVTAKIGEGGMVRSIERGTPRSTGTWR